ncbi:MAG: hypothetical protein GC181_12635 [Bacteroidetes bacterium]|nr:hypothetical protein [Bacteroidota bacterium]
MESTEPAIENAIVPQAGDTTPGVSSVEFPAAYVTVIKPMNPELQTHGTLDGNTGIQMPAAYIDVNQDSADKTSSLTQTQRSESTSSGTNNSIINADLNISQDRRGNNIAPYVEPDLPGIRFTPFDKALEGAPKKYFYQGETPSESKPVHQENRVVYYPAYGEPRIFPDDDSTKPNAFGVRTMSSTLTPKYKPKKKKRVKKKPNDSVVIFEEFHIWVDNSKKEEEPVDQKTVEEYISTEAGKVMHKLNLYNGKNLGKPIPLTPRELTLIMLDELIELRKRNPVMIFRGNSDGYFFRDTSREYYLTKQMGDVPPGIYNSSDINYYFLGLVSSLDYRSEIGDKIITKAYNYAEMSPGLFSGNIDSMVHNYHQTQIGPAFSDLGFKLGMEYKKHYPQ